MLYKALAMLVRIDFPKLLNADTEFRHVAIFVEVVFGNQLFSERTTNPFADQGIFAEQLHPAHIGVFRLAVFANAHVTGCDTPDSTILVIQHF